MSRFEKGLEMPWFPDFVNALELARLHTRAVGRLDPVVQYVEAIQRGDTRPLETVWPGSVVVYDPRAGRVSDHKRLRAFVKGTQAWLAEHQVRIETIATAAVDGRAAVELLPHVRDGRDAFDWPVAVIAESPDDTSVVFRTYCSQWTLDRRQRLRHPILAPGDVDLPSLVAHFLAALAAADVEAVVSCFAADGYVRESLPPPRTHRGIEELRSFFTAQFSAGGGITLEPCVVTDDGVRCAVELNWVRRGNDELPPQAGMAVFECSTDGFLAAVRFYDDVEPPG